MTAASLGRLLPTKLFELLLRPIYLFLLAVFLLASALPAVGFFWCSLHPVLIGLLFRLFAAAFVVAENSLTVCLSSLVSLLDGELWVLKHLIEVSVTLKNLIERIIGVGFVDFALFVVLRHLYRERSAQQFGLLHKKETNSNILVTSC